MHGSRLGVIFEARATYYVRPKEPIEKGKEQDLFSVRVPTIGRRRISCTIGLEWN